MAVLSGPAIGFLFLSVLVTGVGVWMVRWVLLPRAVTSLEGAGTILRVHLTRLALVSAILLPVTMALILVRQVAAFRDPYAPLRQDLSLLLGSLWGKEWLVGMAGSLLVLAAGIVIRRMHAGGWWAYFLGLLTVVVFSSLSGHAGGIQGSMRFLILLADVLHLLAAGIWVGSLATILALEVLWRRQAGSAEPETVLPVLVPVFSPLALVGAGILGITGLMAAWVHLPDPLAPWNTGYGRILLLKLAVVSGMLGLGAWNWKRGIPGLSAPGGPKAMRRSAAVELGAAALVILITAVLVRTSPTAAP